jgi:hypothetical protein
MEHDYRRPRYLGVDHLIAKSNRTVGELIVLRAVFLCRLSNGSFLFSTDESLWFQLSGNGRMLNFLGTGLYRQAPVAEAPSALRPAPGECVMSPPRYINGRSFDPETLKCMGNAFEAACKRLELSETDPFREKVAERVILFAQRGVNNPAALCERVIRSF